MKKTTILAFVLMIFMSNNIFNINAQEKTTSINKLNTKATGVTFKEQFPNSLTAQTVADTFGLTVDDVIDDTIISINYLNLDDKNLTDITGIEIFTNLRTIYLSDNKLNTLPESIGSLSDMDVMFLDNNEISSLPESIVDLSNLTVLELNNNKISSLPEDIEKLSRLDYLGLGNNNLTSIPESITKLSNLTYLVLRDNNISQLPEDFGNLVNLIKFFMQNNQLTSIPDSIVNIETIGTLDFTGNQLTSLPSNWNASPAFNIYLTDNLLPSTYLDNIESHRKLTLKSGLVDSTIRSISDLNNFNFRNAVELSDGNSASLSHKFQFENYVDENNNVVDLNDFIVDGVIQQDKTVFAQIRALGNGMFLNNSDNALTLDKVKLNFKVTYFKLSFDLNGGQGQAPTTQLLIENTKSILVNNPTKAGYVFNSWNTKKDGTGQDWNFDSSLMTNKDIKLYATWTKVSGDIVDTQPTPPIKKDKLPKAGVSSNLLLFSLLVLSLTSGLTIMKKNNY